MGLDDAVPEGVPADLEPGTMVGEYRIEWKLGEGGMASVYAATHPVIGKKAAIKVISPSLFGDADCVERFVLEAHAANEIGHPNIVDVFAFGQLPDGRCYFVMEWLQGSTLSQRLDRETSSLGESCAILEQICDALEATHEKGIVHRDLKPDNVFLVPVRGRREQVKLLDFGIAKVVGRRRETTRWKTEPDFVMGTPDYLSPEQARGRDVDHRTDIYALGVIAYEMFDGRLPFEASSAIDVIHMQVHEPPPRFRRPDVPRPLERLIRQMLAKEPEARPSLARVRCVLREVRLRAAAQRALPRHGRHARTLLFAAVALALVSSTTLAGLALRQDAAHATVAAHEVPAPAAVVVQAPKVQTRVTTKRPERRSRAMATSARGGDYVLDPFATHAR